MTIEEKKEYQKRYYNLHKEKLNATNREYSKRYRKNNVEKIKEYREKYYLENAEEISKRKKEYRINNPLKAKEIQKKYRDTHRKEINEALKNKLKNDSKYKFEFTTRTLIRNSFRRRNFKKESRTAKILGCEMEFFFKYIESLFEEGMNFENYGEWHIDHIVPIAIAQNEEEIIKLNHYTNLRPLWAIENFKKGHNDKKMAQRVKNGQIEIKQILEGGDTTYAI